jgi:Phospholipase_D-nuclease N-terminal
MLRFLLYAIPIVLTIYSVVDCAQTPDAELRGLPRFAWLAVIVFVLIAGPAAWLIFGRKRGGPERARVPWSAGPARSGPEPRPTRRVVAPDDDPEFLSQLGRTNREQDALIEEWERDLRRRENDLRGDSPESGAGDGAGDDPDSDGGADGAKRPRT